MTQVFETTDAALAEHILRDNYGADIRIDANGRPAGLRLEAAAITSSLRLDRLKFSLDFNLRADPLGVLIFCHIRSGRISYRSEGSESVYGVGDAYLPVRPDQAYAARCEDADVFATVLDPALPDRVTDTGPHRFPGAVRFTSNEPVSAAAARTWERTYGYLRVAMQANSEIAQHPLLRGSAARLLVTAALTVFPNNALTDPTIEDRHDAHPATLRRAIAYIDANAHRDISPADIALASAATIRSIRLAFRRHLDTTPMAYLRRARLDAAHRALQDADPSVTSVGTVAARWGFANPGRFAENYRAAFGVHPARTLNQG